MLVFFSPKARCQLDVPSSPPEEGRGRGGRGGGGECAHCLTIRPEEVFAWLCPLSGRDVGGVAVARSGVSGGGGNLIRGLSPGQACPPSSSLQLEEAAVQTEEPLSQVSQQSC